MARMCVDSPRTSAKGSEERKRIEIVEQASNRDLDIVGIQESWEKAGGGIGCKVGEFAWIGKKRGGQDSKNRGAGGVGFLVKEGLRDIILIEVIEDTKFD